MDFNFTEEQVLLRDAVGRFVREEYTFEARRQILASNDGMSREMWSTMAELGLMGMPFSEDDGGFGGGPVDTMVVMEELGRGLVVEPYLSSVILAGGALRAAAPSEMRNTLISNLVAGESILAFAHEERGGRGVPSHVALSAEKTESGYVLNGEKAVVLWGGLANQIVVSARTAGDVADIEGITLFMVDAGAIGLTRRAYETVDGGQAAELKFDGVQVDASAILGKAGDGFAIITQVLDEAIAAVCAESLGVMKALHEQTLEYAQTRKQFGQPIGKFQVTQHKLVDMYAAYEEAVSMTYMATLKLNTNVVERRRSASAAKAMIGKSVTFVGETAIQIHGGMGMTDELAASHYFKRLTMIEAMFGNRDYHLRQLAHG